jgi:O-antigen/teichoic acid export membrane protein
VVDRTVNGDVQPDQPTERDVDAATCFPPINHEQVLGACPDGRAAEAMPLEKTLADRRDRVLRQDVPEPLTTQDNLASTSRDGRRVDKVIAPPEQTVVARESQPPSLQRPPVDFSPLTGTRHSDGPSADASATESSMQPKRLLAGFGWNTAGQFLVVGISIGLTPFLLHHLGATQYGIFALVSSLIGLLSNLDGGLAPAGYRYFPVYVGRGDVAATTSFLLTMLTLVVIVVGALTATMVLVAPAVVGLFVLGSGLASHSHELAGNAHEAVQLIRFLLPTLLVGAICTPIQRLIMAHHRWAFLNYTGVLAMVVYAVTAVGVSFATSGLQCLIWAAYAQRAILLITAVWACRRYISLRSLRWLPISEVRQILRFGSRVQIAALASSFNYEVDALLVGFLFPVRFVAYYSIGANFSQQVTGFPINGLNPILQDIGQTYGRRGKEGVLRSFPGIQRMWVTALGISPIVAALVGWFGIRVWLGHGAQLAAATATLLVIGTAPLLFNAVVDVTAKVVGMPEIESWYLGIGVAINVACTVPLGLTIGVIGVPLGTAIGQVVSFFICIHLARKKIGKQITPFFRCISYAPALVAIAVAGMCEWSLHASLPAGGIGLVLSGLLTVPAFLIYYGWVYREPLLQWYGAQAVANLRRGRRHRSGHRPGRHRAHSMSSAANRRQAAR